MNVQVQLPFRDRLVTTLNNKILEFSTNYRKRALGVGLIKLVLCSSFVLVWWLTRAINLEEERNLFEPFFGNSSILYPMDIDHETTEYAIWTYLYTTFGGIWFGCNNNPSVCSMVFKRCFHRDITAISYIIHMFSAISVIWASFKCFRRPFNITLCLLAKWMNLVLVVLDILIFAVLNQIWAISFGFIWFNYYFNREASGLLILIQMLAPPPPGHSV